MLLCIFVVYATSDVVGSPYRMYDLLTEAARLHPVAGNEDGSYLTMKSENGGYIGLIFIGAGFAAAVDSQLFVDPNLRPHTNFSQADTCLCHLDSKKPLRPIRWPRFLDT